MNREDIHLIGKNSNWSENSVEKALQKHVYNDAESWRKFLKLLFISLGIGFTTSGITFFFAYNWSDLHKFLKIGMIEGLILLTTSFVLFSKFKPSVKNIILTGTAVLVGVLFAVFGQVYQTGANAYDFFLGWTVFITLWVIISNFPALWLVYLLLINTTLVLYAEQVAHQWSDIFVLNLLFALNTVVLIFFIWLSENKKSIAVPNWFTNIIALAAISLSTLVP